MDGVFLGFGWGVWDEYLAPLEYNLFGKNGSTTALCSATAISEMKIVEGVLLWGSSSLLDLGLYSSDTSLYCISTR
jgi:hypothetical protein